MIPKVINYCWFGKGEKSQLILDCINSWKQYMTDYEIIEWNEDNFDININEYVKEAYNQKKWAFVSDYARLWILYNYGGIYMDTDVKVFNSFDCFLNNKAFTGFENIGYPVTATMGSEINNPIIKLLLDYYINKQFELKEWYELTTNTVIISNILKELGIDVNNNVKQELEDITIYPQDTFCFDFRKKEINDSVYSIHLMLGSWG